MKSNQAYFDIDKSFMVLSVAPLEASLSHGQLFLCIIQAVQLLQAEVAPHYVQLQHCIVIHSVQQFWATLTGKHNNHWASGRGCLFFPQPL